MPSPPYAAKYGLIRFLSCPGRAETACPKPSAPARCPVDALPFSYRRFNEVILAGSVPPYRFHPFTVGFDFGIAGVHSASTILLSRGKTPANRRTFVLRHLSTQFEATRLCERAAVAISIVVPVEG